MAKIFKEEFSLKTFSKFYFNLKKCFIKKIQRQFSLWREWPSWREPSNNFTLRIEDGQRPFSLWRAWPLAISPLGTQWINNLQPNFSQWEFWMTKGHSYCEEWGHWPFLILALTDNGWDLSKCIFTQMFIQSFLKIFTLDVGQY